MMNLFVDNALQAFMLQSQDTQTYRSVPFHFQSGGCSHPSPGKETKEIN
jgi:hypothetical protein